MIFITIWGMLIYVRFLGFAQLPDPFATWIAGLEQSPMLTQVFIMLVYAMPRSNGIDKAYSSPKRDLIFAGHT